MPASLADEPAVRRHHEPRPAVLDHVLACDLAGLRVVDVVVERPAVVRDLQAAVLAANRPEQRALDAGACRQRSPLVVDRPSTRAVAVAAALPAAMVACECIQRAALAVEEDAAVARLAHV